MGCSPPGSGCPLFVRLGNKVRLGLVSSVWERICLVKSD
jgi:hypothetical protein